ncbi:DNA-binding protein [Dorea formicigenerans]|uniref:DNA-binding protein n=1 Tax=Dorea formicigenerans TaxID=39486 RepID=A0A3E4PH39_9FIRM|nr:DNA-binding protein [Dorea formicigenerans]RGK79269.1 DNA-binding protein [Dorea formicigenerans]
MRTNYMMTVDDVMEELDVKRSKAYSILKQLNDELAKEGYVAVRGKIPRPYWETKFYGCSEGLRCQLTKTKHREPGM